MYRDGFYQSTSSKPNGVFVHTIVAKIPVGYNIERASNIIGTGSTISWDTPKNGTGNWERYTYIIKAGSTGTFSSFGYVYLIGPETDVTWYVASATVIDITK